MAKSIIAENLKSWLLWFGASNCKDTFPHEQTNEISNLLWGILKYLQQNDIEDAIRGLPDMTKLLSALLRTEAIILSCAAEPLFRCLMLLIPELFNPGPHVSKDLASQASLIPKEIVRRRSMQWCCERLQAVCRGSTTYQSHHSEPDAAVDFLYDCGFSHEQMHAAVSIEASRLLKEVLDDPHGIWSTPHAVKGIVDAAVGLLQIQNHENSELQLDLLRSLIRTKFSQENSQHADYAVAVATSAIKRGHPDFATTGGTVKQNLEAELLDGDDTFFLHTLAEAATLLVSRPFISEDELAAALRPLCTAAGRAPWLFRAATSLFEAGLVAVGSADSRVAQALGLLRRGAVQALVAATASTAGAAGSVAVEALYPAQDHPLVRALTACAGYGQLPANAAAEAAGLVNKSAQPTGRMADGGCGVGWLTLCHFPEVLDKCHLQACLPGPTGRAARRLLSTVAAPCSPAGQAAVRRGLEALAAWCAQPADDAESLPGGRRSDSGDGGAGQPAAYAAADQRERRREAERLWARCGDAGPVSLLCLALAGSLTCRRRRELLAVLARARRRPLPAVAVLQTLRRHRAAGGGEWAAAQCCAACGRAAARVWARTVRAARAAVGDSDEALRDLVSRDTGGRE